MELEWKKKALNDAKKHLLAKETKHIMRVVEQLSEMLQICKLSVSDLRDDEEDMRSWEEAENK
jgi:hypothetical protein